MNIETVVEELEATNPVTGFTGLPADQVWSGFRANIGVAGTSHRRAFALAAMTVVAVAVVVALAFSNVFPLSTPTNAAATELTRIADSVKRQLGTPILRPGQYDYLSYRLSGGIISAKVHGKWIYATQNETYQQWTRPHGTAVSGKCRMVTTVQPIRFLRGSAKVWRSVDSPTIGHVNSDVILRDCGRLEPWFGMTPPTKMTPATLLQAFQSRQRPVSDSQIFLGLVLVNLAATPTPALRHATLIDMAHLSGVKALGAEVDSLGRRGLAFSYEIPLNPQCLGSDCGPWTESIILDPSTGALLSINSNEQGSAQSQTIVAQSVVNSITDVTPSNFK